MKKILSCLAAYLTICYFSHANNLQITNVTHTITNGSHYLNFSISWENSWRTSSAPFNWDAVWVFVKRRDCAGLQWRHANLAPQDTAHSSTTPLFVDAYADKKGVMIYRAADSSGNINNVSVRLKLDSVPPGNYDYQVFGIEMVYIPQGPFYVGDGASASSLSKGDSIAPYLVSSEAPIQIGGLPGQLSYFNNIGSSNVGIVLGTVLETSYPKGFDAFYIMKYEISQGQYAGFLNCLTQDAIPNRFVSGNSGNDRNTISGNWPQLASTTPNRACNFLSFQDVAAYLDWSALSPMTELEYEKACRGSGNTAVSGEMAWGGTLAVDANTIAAGTDGTPNEKVTDTILTDRGIANFSGDANTFVGPLRCGFAANNATDRYSAGSTYYGIMEMSGNLIERCYNLAKYSGNNYGGGFFTGTHGDGELTAAPNTGFSNAGWPDEGAGPFFLDNYSVAKKGGGYNRTIDKLRISDRSMVELNESGLNQYRLPDYGGRGVSRRQQ